MNNTKGKVDVKPSDVGYDESRLDILNNHFGKLVDNNKIYGATYCLSRKGQTFASGSIGYKDYKKSVVVEPDDIHYIASMGKTFTAVAIMKLFEDGITRLDVPVGQILPQFNSPPFSGITLYHLLTHTSGMHPDGGCFPNKHNGGGYWYFIEQGYDACNNKDDFDWIAAALAHGVCLKPNEQWMYCSFGFSILGSVIEKLTGIKAEKFIEDNICKPLGLNDTAYHLNKKTAPRYMLQNEKAEKDVSNIMSGTISERTPPWDKIPMTSGGLKSSVYDMVRFGNMILNNGTIDNTRILGRKAVEKMTDFAIMLPNYCWDAGGVVREYGIGFDHRNDTGKYSFSETTIMHEGAGACALYIDPEEELVAAWISPFVDMSDWCMEAMCNTINIIWSGLK